MSPESLEWSKAAETAPAEKIEGYRKKSIEGIADTYHIEKEDLNKLSIERDEDHISINGSIKKESISLNRTPEGVQGKRGDRVLASHEAEIEYLKLSRAISERDRENDKAIGVTIDAINKHHRVLSKDLKEKPGQAERAEKDPNKLYILKAENITYESPSVALSTDEFGILRDGFQLGVEAAQKILGASYAGVPFTIRCESYDNPYQKTKVRVSFPAERIQGTRMIRDFDNSFDNFDVPGGVWEPSDKISFAEWTLSHLLSNTTKRELESYLKDPEK